MYQDIYELISKYNEQNKQIDAYFMNNVCEMIRDNEKLKEYVKCWSFEKMRSFAIYSCIERKIFFNITSARPLEVYKKFFPQIATMVYNYDQLGSIFHEFMHAIQFRRIMEHEEDSNSFFSRLYSYDESFKEDLKFYFKPTNLIRRIYYHRHHNDDFLEREANITADMKIQQVLSFDKDKESDTYIHLKLVEDYITILEKLIGYKLNGDITNSPTIDYLSNLPFTSNRRYFKDHPNEFKDLSLPYETRLLYGFYLTGDEYQKLEDNRKELVRKIIEYR